MSNKHNGIFKFQLRRAIGSGLLPYAFLSLFAMVTICFVQSCLMFWGHDRGEVPSAATLWVGNGWRSNAELMNFMVWFLLFPLTSALFAASFFEDRNNHGYYLIASRTTAKSYFLAGGTCSFGSAFLMTLAVILVSQALAFIAFPAYQNWDAYFAMLDLAPTSQSSFAMLEGQPLSTLLFSNRYLYNLVYCFYLAFFAGAMAIATYALSLFLKQNRLVLLGVPTMVLLGVSAVLPDGHNIANLLLPGTYVTTSLGYLACIPLILFGCAVILLTVSQRLRKDIAL